METWNETDEWADRYVRGDLSGEDRVALIKWLEASPEHLRQFRKILQTEMRVSAAVRPDTGTGVGTYYSGPCES